MLTLTEENYLKAIYKLSNHGQKNVSTSEIADMLDTKAASVSDMLKKLAAKDLLSYEKYYGVNISNSGIGYACKIIRKHRLWEVFLVDTLNFSWDQVHEVAEQLEHVKSNLLIDRLEEFLGFPKFDPHGGAIPDKNGNWPKEQTFRILEAPLEVPLVLNRVEGGSELLKHLDTLELKIGTVFKILSIRNFDKLLEVELESGNVVNLTEGVTNNLFVLKNEA